MEHMDGRSVVKPYKSVNLILLYPVELFGNVAFAFICDLRGGTVNVDNYLCSCRGSSKEINETAMKARRKDETTKTNKVFGITLRKKNAKIVDGEECVKKNQRAGPPVQELSVNIVFKAMAIETKKPSLLEDLTDDLV